MATGYSPAMTSGRNTAAVILILVAVAAAAPFAPGTRFGTIGTDYRFSSGDLYTYSYDSQYVKIDPFFRVGVAVLPNVAVGAELALFNTFPSHGDVPPQSPVVSFGPAVAYFVPLIANRFQCYGVASGSVTYSFQNDYRNYLGGRARLSAGMAAVTHLPVIFGLEVGWYADWTRLPVRSETPPHLLEYEWPFSSSVFAGLRVTGLTR
jgi:hypothetical protein